jgi:hypothetical protein
MQSSCISQLIITLGAMNSGNWDSVFGVNKNVGVAHALQQVCVFSFQQAIKLYTLDSGVCK